jgi:hypothetical protein
VSTGSMPLSHACAESCGRAYLIMTWCAAAIAAAAADALSPGGEGACVVLGSPECDEGPGVDVAGVVLCEVRGVAHPARPSIRRLATSTANVRFIVELDGRVAPAE